LKQYQETLHKDYGQCLDVDELIYDGRSDHQDLVIFHNPFFGRVLALDGAIQTTEKDEFIYHEMLTHVPVLAHGKVKKALVIGVGDGGIIRELTRHTGIDEIVAVEIDQAVIDMCLKYLPNHSAGSLDDPRVRLIIDDGLRFLEETDETFDVIITDSTDPIGPAETLFTEQFYELCKNCLNEGGILATQNGVPFFQPEELSNTAKRLAPHFPGWHFYHAAIPTYVGGSMSFGWGALDPESRRVPLDELERRFAESGLKTRYYTPEIHQAAFALPRYMLDLIGR